MSSPSKPILKLDWCSFEAARYAVLHWHYSKRMPTSKMVRVGVWEGGKFIGAIVFGCGANQNHGKRFGLTQFQVCELLRVALTNHETPVTRMISIAIKMLKKHSPGMRLIVSYADSEQGHNGGIYAGGGWTYVGKVETEEKGTPMWVVHGKKMHGKSVYERGWKQNIEWLRAHVDPKATRVYPKGKHKYFMPLDDGIREKLRPMALSNPKRAASETGDTPLIQSGKGGSTPTAALKEVIASSQNEDCTAPIVTIDARTHSDTHLHKHWPLEPDPAKRH